MVLGDLIQAPEQLLFLLDLGWFRTFSFPVPWGLGRVCSALNPAKFPPDCELLEVMSVCPSTQHSTWHVVDA